MRDECTRPEDPGERSAYEAGYEAGMSLAASRESVIDRLDALLTRAATLLACKSGFDAKAADSLIAEIRAEIGDFDDDPESPYDANGNLIRGDFEEDDED